MALEVHAPPASPTADAPSPAPLTSQELELVLRKGFRPLAQSFDDVEFGKNAYSALPRPTFVANLNRRIDWDGAACWIFCPNN